MPLIVTPRCHHALAVTARCHHALDRDCLMPLCPRRDCPMPSCPRRDCPIPCRDCLMHLLFYMSKKNSILLNSDKSLQQIEKQLSKKLLNVLTSKMLSVLRSKLKCRHERSLWAVSYAVTASPIWETIMDFATKTFYYLKMFHLHLLCFVAASTSPTTRTSLLHISSNSYHNQVTDV